MGKYRDDAGRGDRDSIAVHAARGMPAPGKLTRVMAAAPLPAQLRGRLERATGSDLSMVRVGEDPSVAAIGARAHARGMHVLFAPGAYQPDTPGGQAVIAHEVMHLVQQAEGRVAPSGTIGGVAATDDAGLEREADDLGDRALAGEVVRAAAPPLVADGPLQGWFDDPFAMASLFDPPTEEAAAAAKARAALRGQGDSAMITANNTARDARTGLLPFEEDAVHAMVVEAERYLAGWADQRQTADLRFAHGDAMAGSFATLRRTLAAGGDLEAAKAEISRRLSAGANKQYVREIRIFAPDMLGDYARLLGLDDPAPSHSYEFMPVFSAGGARSLYGVKIGAQARRIRIRYTNSAIAGLTWEQEVSLGGFVLGFSVSPGLAKAGAEVSGEPPGDWTTAANQPCRKYLAPAFFDGADYTRPSAGAAGKLGGGQAGPGASQLLISRAGDKLRWDMPLGVEVEGGFGDSTLENPVEQDVEAEALIESGTTSTVGELALQPGKWPEVVYHQPAESERWIPLHVARLYYKAGSADLDSQDLATMAKLVDAIHARDKMAGYRGQIFKIEVCGSHSQEWQWYDVALRALDAIPAASLTEKQRKRREELEVLKTASNEALAYDRASTASDALKVLLGNLEGRMYLGLKLGESIDDPTTHSPIGDPYSDDYRDRTVLITVSYKLFSPTGQVPSPGGAE